MIIHAAWSVVRERKVRNFRSGAGWVYQRAKHHDAPPLVMMALPLPRPTRSDTHGTNLATPSISTYTSRLTAYIHSPHSRGQSASPRPSEPSSTTTSSKDGLPSRGWRQTTPSSTSIGPFRSPPRCDADSSSHYRPRQRRPRRHRPTRQEQPPQRASSGRKGVEIGRFHIGDS